MSFKLKIVTPFGVFFEGDIDSLNICTKQGYLTILPNHIPLITPLEIRSMTYKINKEEHICALAGGIMYINKNDVKIIANACENKEDIDIDRAIASKERALKRIESKDSNINMLRAEISLKKAINRINTYNN